MKNLKLEGLAIWMLLFFCTGTGFGQFSVMETGTTGLAQMDDLCGNNPGYEYRLVSNVSGYAASAIWNNSVISLDDSFREDFRIRFEEDPFDNNADGICFVLSSTPALGGDGGWLGYDGLPTTSLGVEFDIWFNEDLGDIEEDHTTLVFNGDVSTPITPVMEIGTNGEIEDGEWHRVSVIWDACNEDFDVFVDNDHVVDYTGDIVNQVFNGNPIVSWGFTAAKASGTSNHDLCAFPIAIDSSCCTGVIPCNEITDLTACVEEGDFGYIALNCGVAFDWTFPANSTAIEYTNAGQSIILNASEGAYQVVITDVDGCTAVRDYIIEEDCCKVVEPDCDPPTGLTCVRTDGITYLRWNEVPGATSYCLNVNYEGDLGCECQGSGTIQIPNITSNAYPAGLLNSKCFTWSVTSKCGDGVMSEPSASACFNRFTTCFSKEFDAPGTDKSFSIAPNTVFPNPSNGTINLDLDVKTAAVVTIEVYNADGKMVKALETFFEIPGVYRQELSLENETENGIYFVKIMDENGHADFQKIIIQR